MRRTHYARGLFVLGLCFMAQYSAAAEGTAQATSQQLLLESKKARDLPFASTVELRRSLGELKELNSKLAAISAGAQSDQKATLDAEIQKNLQAIEEREKTIAERIAGSVRPMFAVLFAPNLDRDSYEVVKDPASADEATGVIHRSQKGGTAGILLAAEWPFWFVRKNGSFFPIGTWFGVQMQNAAGSAIEGVDLAAGFSGTFLSKSRLSEYLAESAGETNAAPARLLVGIVYGSVDRLRKGLAEGDGYPLGEAPPVAKQRRFAFTAGLGFRF